MSESTKTFIEVQSILRNYILSPDISIQSFQPKILPRKPELSRLYYLPNCPASTSLISKRDQVSGEIIDFIEVINENAEETAQNSTSLRRIPNPLDETIRGSIMNCPFWPGGIDKPKKSIEEMKVDCNSIFDEELLTIPPDFDSGYNFKEIPVYKKENNDSVMNNDDGKVNLLKSLEEQPELEEWLINVNKDEESEIKNEDNVKSNITNFENIDENDEKIFDVPSSVLEISKFESKTHEKVQAQWAEVIDASQPVTDFEQKIPYPAKQWDFELDPFQKQAVLKVENHEYVFVAAHTSAGKTVVAEYAIALSKKHMTKTIYTSPIKALSNQKYRDFKKEFNDVGLITGDMQIEPQASCLIMTTEVLRSMLYCGSDVTRDLEFVILDEVHYINDTERGHVWEEVLILLPDHVTVIMLSATVPNTVEFADWIGNIKKRKVYVISTYKRPVPLMHYLYVVQGVGNKIKDNLHCIVDAESQFIFKNYSDVEHRLNLKKKEKNLKNAQLRNKSEISVWNNLIGYLQRDQKLPVIIFVLSRKRCDDLAKLITVDLNTNKERNELNHFFTQCLKTLKEPDQNLPQLKWMKNSLDRGIGVHHSGILPILKEIVEMCFQRGLVKVLFATETFAMGVNMPAKTVVFDSVEKYDGTYTRQLNSAEYIQMAGRAGRRGHDDNGMVIVVCKNYKLPSSVDLKSMILGRPEKLVSKFVLRYAVVLTCLRTENVKVENIVSHSYLAYYSKQKLPTHEKQLEIEKEKYSKLKELGEHLKPLCDYYDISVQYMENMQDLMKKCLSHPKIFKELYPGRVIIISHGTHYNKLAILLLIKGSTIKVLVLDHKYEKDSKTNAFQDKQCTDDIWNKLLSYTPKYKYFHPDGIGGHCVLDINLTDIQQITKNSIKIDADNIIQNWNQRQMERFKNDPPSQKVIQAVAELNTLNNAYISSLQNLQYFNLNDYLDIDSLDTMEKVKELKFQLDDLIQYTDTTNFEYDFRIVYEHKSLIRKISDLEWKKSWKSLSLYPDYCNRLNVLKELGFVNKDEEVELKGKIACEMGQNEIILTELISNNIIHGLDTAEIAALLSSLVFQAQTKITPKMNKKLEKAIKDMEEIGQKIEETEKRYGVMNVERRERLNFGLVEVVYEWAQNKPFAQIMQLTDIQEGIIVRCIQQLDEIIRDVKTAAKRIGDRTLECKMEEVSAAVRRDIVFAASLYTTLEED